MVLRRTMAIATTSPTKKTMMENVVIASTRGAESAAGAAGGKRVLDELGSAVRVVAVDRLCQKVGHGVYSSRMTWTGYFRSRLAAKLWRLHRIGDPPQDAPRRAREGRPCD
jgi:hypothetical protein